MLIFSLEVGHAMLKEVIIKAWQGIHLAARFQPVLLGVHFHVLVPHGEALNMDRSPHTTVTVCHQILSNPSSASCMCAPTKPQLTKQGRCPLGRCPPSGGAADAPRGRRENRRHKFCQKVAPRTPCHMLSCPQTLLISLSSAVCHI